MDENKAYYTYIVCCTDNTLYTGYTGDVVKRVAAHNSGRAARYTRARLPVALVYAERLSTKNEAMSREAKIKKLTREDKLKLINDWGGEY